MTENTGLTVHNAVPVLGVWLGYTSITSASRMSLSRGRAGAYYLR